ncbi:hypothetical protein [Algiphilus sp.]|uniref:hypothetical protein n=1 Tax=Algiphilus sp. TaxID=1872431 RepID=UPI003C39402C
MRFLRAALAFLGAVIVAAATGSLWQTHRNIVAIETLGHEVPAGLALRTAGQDLAGFAPMYAALCGTAFLVAFPIAAWLWRRLDGGRLALFAVAGAAAVLTMLAVMDLALPVTAIAAARTALGTAGLALAGAAAGAVFAGATAPPRAY